ncbi:MAG: DUF2330 domain-containing protein [Brachybacterium sp.]
MSTASVKALTPRRRLGALLAGAVLLAQLILGAASPAAACACGGFVDPDDLPDGANVMKETVVLSLRDGVQTTIMGLALDAERVGSALLMPTPAVPEVSAAQSGTLREMAAATAPREVIEYDYWGENPSGPGSGDGAGAPPTEGAGQPTVHEQSRIGNYEVAVLGGEADGVRAWLTDNGYALPEELSELIVPYAEEGWTFTAVRYAADAVLSGDVEPLRFDFATNELIHPMRFSQAAETSQHVHLYVLAETPVRRTDSSAAQQEVSRPWIGSPTNNGWTWSDATLRELVGADLRYDSDTGEHPVRHRVVTEFEVHGAPDSFATDFTFTPDPGAEEVIPTYSTTKVVTVMGLPVGWVLVLAGVVTVASLLLAAVSTAVAARSRRSAQV